MSLFVVVAVADAVVSDFIAAAAAAAAKMFIDVAVSVAAVAAII